MPVMTPAPALGFASKLAVGDATPTDKPLDFISETLGLRENFIDLQGMRGTRSHGANRVRAAGRVVTGNVVMAPTAVELGYLLPYIMGGTPTVSGTGKNYPFAEALPAFFTQILRGNSLFTYSGCRVSRAEFRAAKGAAVQLTVDVLGVDETKAAGSGFPVLALDSSTQYFLLEDSATAVTINGDTVDCYDLTVTIDNAVQARPINNQVATVVYSTDRIVTVQISVPWGDDEALYALSQAGVPVTAVFTNGNTQLSFTMPKVAFPRQSPDVANRDEIRNVLNGVARYNAAPNDECVLFLDLAP